jgi:hypothetical protein
VESRAVLDLQLISKELAAFTEGKRLPIISVPKTSEPAVAPTAQQVPKPVTDFDREWDGLQPKARALRRDSLSRADIETYRQELETIARSHPRQLKVWDELFLILISYQRDRKEALRVARSAREHAQQSPNLKQMCDIVEMWAA